jgi:hypothetical protein
MTQYFALFVAMALVGCSSSDIIRDQDKNFTGKYITKAFNSSYQSWLDLKHKHHANYSYERDTVSSTNFYSSTKLTIKNGQVEYRDFFEWQAGNTPKLSWSESFSELNLHTQGASAKTLDQLYQQCKNQILTKPKAQHKITLSVDRFNILQQCSYTVNNCSTNCTKGIRIQGLSL